MNQVLWREETNIEEVASLCYTKNLGTGPFHQLLPDGISQQCYPNWDRIKITQEKEMCIAAVTTGSEQPQNSPVQHQ